LPDRNLLDAPEASPGSASLRGFAEADPFSPPPDLAAASSRTDAAPRQPAEPAQELAVNVRTTDDDPFASDFLGGPDQTSGQQVGALTDRIAPGGGGSPAGGADPAAPAGQSGAAGPQGMSEDGLPASLLSPAAGASPR
jgi:hypothetical protein